MFLCFMTETITLFVIERFVSLKPRCRQATVFMIKLIVLNFQRAHRARESDFSKVNKRRTLVPVGITFDLLLCCLLLEPSRIQCNILIMSVILFYL